MGDGPIRYEHSMRAKLKKLLVSCTFNPIPPLHLSQHQSIVAKYMLGLYSFTQWWVSASYNTYNIPLWWNMGYIYIFHCETIDVIQP